MTGMRRRHFLAGAAAGALARPAIAANGGSGTKTLIFVPQTNLTSLDPVWTTATATRNFALMVYEGLYGRDQQFVPRPLMVEGHVIDDDGKRWTMTLREGLLWHDGTKVLARDCVASLQRWMKRDATAPIIMDRVEAFEATDDRTIVWRLRRPFPLLAHFLSKVQPQPVDDAGTSRRDRSVQADDRDRRQRAVEVPAGRICVRHSCRVRSFRWLCAASGAGVLQCRRPQGECRPRGMAGHSRRIDRCRRADRGRGRLAGTAATRPDPDAGPRRMASPPDCSTFTAPSRSCGRTT